MALHIEKAQVNGVVCLAKDIAVEGEGKHGEGHADEGNEPGFSGQKCSQGSI